MHDTGYLFCETMEKWNMHPTYGAEVARMFLMKIGYYEGMIGRSDIGERSARELIEVCEKRQRTLTNWQDRICGTDTAKAFWEEKLQMRRQFYEALQAEMLGTLEIEELLKE